MIVSIARRSAGWLMGIGTLCLLTAAAPAAACTGDCDGNGEVAVNELLEGVNIALGNQPMSVCPVFDAEGDGAVTINELLAAVRAALDGCPAATINTIAGTGIAGINDDGLPPTESNLYLPQDVTVGPDGYVYVVDWNNHRIRRIKDGVFETIAGTGELGDGKDGVAIYTQFNHPTNVTFDHEGRMIIAAWHNSLVKRLDFSTGLVTNLAGTGARAFGGDGGPGNDAKLDLPSSVVVDSNSNIIISDQANYRLRILEPNNIINTFAGIGTPGGAGDEGPAILAQLNGPKGQSAAPASRIDIDARNRIYIADTGNNRIRMIDEVGTIHTIAGSGVQGYSGDGGPALDAQFNTPSDIAVAPNGTLYIADTMNNVVRAISPGGIVSTFAGNGSRGFSGDGGPAKEAELDRPYGIGLAPNGAVYVADTHNQRVRLVTGVSQAPPPTPRPTPPPEIIPCTDVVGSICTFVGNGIEGYNGEGKNRLETVLYWPFDISFLSNGRRVFLDWNNHKVREILPDETIQTIVGSDFVGDGPPDLSDLTPEGAPPLTVDLNHPTDLLEFPNHDIIIMAWHNHKIRVIDHDTGRVRILLGAGAAFAGDGGPAKDARVNQPPHGTWDGNGNFFFIDQRNERIRVIHDFATLREDGIIDTIAGTGTAGFNGDGAALATQLNLPAGGNPEPSGGLSFGPDGALYFSDTNNNRVRKIVFAGAPDFKDGQIVTVAGTGDRDYGGDGGQAAEAQISYPQDLEFGPDGNLYFADTNNNRVRMVDLSTGVITTVVGTGEKGYAGDGGQAVDAELDRPFGVAFDDVGDLYVSDTFNSRIRKVKR